MPTLFENGIVRVRSPWFGGWRIDHKLTGKTIRPDTQLAVQMGLTWKLLRSKKYRELSPLDRSAEDLLMGVFAMCALQPDSQMAVEFRGQRPEDLAHQMATEATNSALKRMFGD